MRKESHKLTFEIAICVEKDGDGFHAYCPALKGIHVDGKTEKAAVENAKTAIGLYLKSMLKHHDPIPLQSRRMHPQITQMTQIDEG